MNRYFRLLTVLIKTKNYPESKVTYTRYRSELLKTFWYLLVFCLVLNTDLRLSQIEKILEKIFPKFLDLYASLYGNDLSEMYEKRKICSKSLI